jgi:hypothetical protein
VKIAISQPTYLPWLGYFDLIDQVDVFVLPDDVQFEKQSWQQRNRIKTPIGLQWLPVPVMFHGRSGHFLKYVNLRLLEWLMSAMGIRTRLLRSSGLEQAGRRPEPLREQVQARRQAS